MTIDPMISSFLLAPPNKCRPLNNDGPADVASIRFESSAGSFDEEQEERGYANFVEHMAFNGTGRFPGNSLIEALRAKGIGSAAADNLKSARLVVARTRRHSASALCITRAMLQGVR